MTDTATDTDKQKGEALTADQAKAVHDAAQQVWAEMKGVLDEVRQQVAKTGDEGAELAGKVEKMEGDLTSKLDQLEAKRNRVELDDQKAEQREATKAFVGYLRKDEKGVAPELAKALVTDTDDDGGFLVPENMVSSITELLVEQSPLRSMVNVETITKGNSLKIPTEDGLFAAQWQTNERTSPSETTSGTFRMEEIPTHTLEAMPTASQQMLEDAGFDVEGWINRKLGEQFGVAEATALVTGDGVGKPEGVLEGGLSGITSGASGSIDADDVLDLIFELPEPYARNASLLWKRSTTLALRKLKDGNDQYLWDPGVNAQTAPTFAGYRYTEAVDMPAIASNAKAIVFADYRRLYTLVDRRGIRTLRDPYSAKPFVQFYTTKRVGGQVVLPEAGRVLTVQ